MHYIHKVGCTSVRQVPVTGTCSFRLTTQIWRDLCLSETQIHRSSDLWVSHGYTCVDPQVTQTRAQPYSHTHIKEDSEKSTTFHFHGGGKSLMVSSDELQSYSSADLHEQQSQFLQCIKKDN